MYLESLMSSFSDELTKIAAEKQAGIFSRIGKGISTALKGAKESRGMLPIPPVPGRPTIEGAKELGKKGLMAAGLMGIGSAGHSHFQRQHEKAMAERTAPYGM